MSKIADTIASQGKLPEVLAAIKETHNHITNLEDLLARCLPYITSSIEDSDYVNRHAEHLANEIRKAVPWLKERDE